MNLTKAVIEAARPPAEGQDFIRDEKVQGLGVRITSNGVKSFVFEGRVRGRPRRITLGRWPVMNVDQARDGVMKIRAAIADGHDPAAEHQAAREEPTFGDLLDSYLADAESRGRRSLDRLRERAGKYLSQWRNRLASDITPADAAELHQRIGKERGRVIANRVAVILLRAIFNHAIKLKLFKGDNPAVAVQRFAEQARERFLTPAELERVNEELTREPHPYWRAYFSATLMLGTRKNELLTAKWSHVDLDARTLRLPVTKNGKSHLLPIPEPILNMLKELPSFERRDQGEGWIFPSNRNGEGHLVEPFKAWQRIRERAGCPDVTIHDLRRSLGSWLASEGHSLLLIGRALGHKSSSATQIYARLALQPLREALEANARLMLGENRGA
jgi:integrase